MARTTGRWYLPGDPPTVVVFESEVVTSLFVNLRGAALRGPVTLAKTKRADPGEPGSARSRNQKGPGKLHAIQAPFEGKIPAPLGAFLARDQMVLSPENFVKRCKLRGDSATRICIGQQRKSVAMVTVYVVGRSKPRWTACQRDFGAGYFRARTCGVPLPAGWSCLLLAATIQRLTSAFWKLPATWI